MDIFLMSISGILVILGMILVGFIIGEKGWFDDKSRGLLAKLVTQVALPCYMLYTITQRFTAADLLKMLPALRFPALSMVILLGIATGVARIFAVRQDRRGLFISMFFNSNTIFVGLPINQALFGDASIPYVLIYYMCNTTFFWTLGTYLIQRDGEGEAQFDLKTSLKKVFSPPLMGFLLGLVLVMLQIKLPAFLASDLQYLGNLTTPLSMIFIGLSVSHVGVKQLVLGKEQLLILLGRFLVAPLLMASIVYWVPLPSLMKQVFIIQSAMPVMTNAPVVARLYGADSDYAAVMVTETTLATMVVIPILMLLMA
ncbi:MAG: AEC family transporter [Streptococcus parasanguinis]|uniref:AEC family transporter n=1 Tax=Streptococcus parasanguinis TaxID=1318 RepID=A0AAE8AFY0_STRPA|nr:MULTISPECIES: AEC family transporter [Streptococcus]MDG3029254.1 AEC family transporter [Streptococcus sp. ST2]MDU5706934.1 AEC family transporter [Streptococcus parasanguinis]MDU5845607.1 AEC family transporter [Streptococcus parasanguinis]MDU6946072.1 AEC family transporter [Streptococcus parasanguinis]RGM03937.1 AEC family transporter [Streptococcus parasanguinis]